MCECINKLRKTLQADARFLDPELQTAVMWNFNDGTNIEKAGKLDFTYYKKKTNGEPYKNPSKSFIAFSHCPFCGEKYESASSISTPGALSTTEIEESNNCEVKSDGKQESNLQ